MTTAISSDPASTAGATTENPSPNVEVTVGNSVTAESASTSVDVPHGTIAEPAAPAAPSYVPNFKYKAALQEKELDPFFHSLVKDAESEKKVKDIFTKVDAFEFVKGKKEAVETQLQSVLQDYDTVSNTVSQFNESIKRGDLSSAFRLAGITKDQIFKWTQQQLAYMEMPAEQRAQYEQFEQQASQKFDLEHKVSQLQQQYEHQAVQARAVQLDVALSRPEVSRFAEAWDAHGEPGSFRNFVIGEAQKAYYETKQDLSPEQAIGLVMQRFGKFLNAGETAVQSPQAIPQNGGQRQNPPVIPNVSGKAASPIKKMPKSLDDLKRIAKELRD